MIGAGPRGAYFLYSLYTLIIENFLTIGCYIKILTNSLIFPLYLVMYYCNHVSVAFCQLCFIRINEMK